MRQRADRVIPGRPPRARSPFFLGRGQKRAPLLHSFVYPVCFCFISLKSFLCCYCSETAIAEVCRLNHVTRHTHTLTQKKKAGHSHDIAQPLPGTARRAKHEMELKRKSGSGNTVDREAKPTNESVTRSGPCPCVPAARRIVRDATRRWRSVSPPAYSAGGRAQIALEYVVLSGFRKKEKLANSLVMAGFCVATFSY